MPTFSSADMFSRIYQYARCEGIQANMNEVGEKWGKYQIERLIATGGMAEIFEANLLGPGGFVKRVCLKRVRPELSSNSQFVEMFESEARIAARLEHPHIVSVTDFDRHDGQLFLAMELVDGVDLRQILSTAWAMGFRLPPEFAVHVMDRLLDALHYAHTLEVDGTPRPVIHRDVSPHNILVSTDGAVKLTDFGIAKAKGVTNDATAQGTIKGKFAYLSPEQASGTPLDARSDLFSAGLVLWEMLTGRRVFQAEAEASILVQILAYEFSPIPHVCASLNDFLSHLLARERAHRFDSAKAARSALCSVPVPAIKDEETKKLVIATREASAWKRDASMPLRRTRELDSEKELLESSGNIGGGNAGSLYASAGSGEGNGRRPSGGGRGMASYAMRPGTAMFLGLAIALALIAIAVAVTGVNKANVASSLSQATKITTHRSREMDGVPPSAASTRSAPAPAPAPVPAPASVAVRVLPSPDLEETRSSGIPPHSSIVGVGKGDEEEESPEPAPPEGMPSESADDANGPGRTASPMGGLAVNVRPWAEVRVDGINRGATPLKALRLKAGKHQVVLANKAMGYRETIRTVVKPGEITTINRVVKRQE